MTATPSPIRLLIVDDHPVVRDGLRGMFSGDPGFDVVGEAADGGEAIELAERLLPDVILMDLRMPGVNGAAAIRTLAERQIPSRVLVLTTYDSDSDVVPAIEAGATGYLLKDSPRAELFRAVRAASNGESVLASSVATKLMSQLARSGPGRAQRARARGARGSSPRARRTAAPRPGCSSPKRPSRRTCSTSTRSSTSTTGPPRWRRRSSAACSRRTEGAE